MKIEQVLVHYLLKSKTLALQGIGTFHLDATIPDNADPDKPIAIPADAIKFTYSSKTGEDDELVNFIVQHTKKIKPLASSDLDSYLSLGRQFLNIGKPFTLLGIGTLEKLNSGELVFVAGQIVAPKLESQRVKIEDEGAEEHDEDMFNDYQKARKGNGGQKAFLIIVGVLIIGLIGWAIWNFVLNNESDHISSLNDLNQAAADSARIKDSLAIYNVAKDSADVVSNASDSFTFKVVVNTYNNLAAAQTRYNNLKLYNRNVILYTSDSLTYKVAEPFTRPLSDTSRVLDSMNRYYSKGKIKIEL